MPRNKAAKRTAKHSSMKNNLAITPKTEKEWMNTPLKLALQLSKEIKNLRKSESKLKATIHKMNAQVKNSENRLKAAEKNKASATGRKQLNIAKKSHNHVVKSQATLNKELQKNIQLLGSLATQYARLS